MDKNEKNFLNAIYLCCNTGMLSTNKVLKKVKDDKLKDLFRKQFEAYQKYADKCDAIAITDNMELKEQSMFTKLKQMTMLYLNLWMNSTPQHIVEMMITGTTMGVIEIIKANKKLNTKNEEIAKLSLDFKKMQEDFLEKLKKQLARV